MNGKICPCLMEQAVEAVGEALKNDAEQQPLSQSDSCYVVSKLYEVEGYTNLGPIGDGTYHLFCQEEW